MRNNEFWPRQTLSTALADKARNMPAQEALVISERRLTYAQLWAEVQRMAAALHASGVKRGDHVAGGPDLAEHAGEA